MPYRKKYSKRKSFKKSISWKRAKSACRSVLRKASELKRITSYVNDGACGDPSVPIHINMNSIVQGLRDFNRVGSEIRLQSYFIRLFLQIPYANNVILDNQSVVFRVCVYSPNASQTSRPVLTTKVAKFPTDLFNLYSENFYILQNRSLTAPPTSNSPLQKMVVIKKRYKFNGRQMVYINPVDTVAQDKNLILSIWSYGDNSANTNSALVSIHNSTWFRDI